MNLQIPLPSFEDIRKLFQFWLNQQDKWFYFENAIFPSGSIGNREVPNQLHTLPTRTTLVKDSEIIQYVQPRIVGCIKDVISFPPSLLLQKATLFTVHLIYTRHDSIIEEIFTEKRDVYGLVFSEITYYEPIKDEKAFLQEDKRIVRYSRD